MKRVLVMFLGLLLAVAVYAQTAEELIAQVKQKFEKVTDYEAKGKMKTNVSFIKAPVADVTILFKKPNKVKIKNQSGISFIPKGSVNISLAGLFTNTGDYDILDGGIETGSALRIIKLLPKDENAEVVLATLYIDAKKALVKKAKTTTRENGTYELEMSYGKYEGYGLADNIIFSFNIKDYKLPKGVTFDYDDGSKKEQQTNKLKEGKGRIEIKYDAYLINKGLTDAAFD